jgi:acyl-CoA dehydrogenase
MDFDLSEDQQAVREVAAALGGLFPDEYWQRIDEEYGFPREFWDELASHDLLGVAVPEEFGGTGHGMLEMALAAETLAEHGAGMDGAGLYVSGPVFGGTLLARHGSQAQKEAGLPGIVAGELWAGAFTEPDAGSNITNVRCTAERRGNVYAINGQKTFISQMKVASRVVVMARTQKYDPAHRTRGISLLFGDLPSERVEAQPMKKMGSHFMDTNQVFFDDYEVPAENIVGQEGQAWRPLYDVLNPERIVLGATAVGTGNLAIRRAVEYAGERPVWGTPIGAHQGVQFPLAVARIELEAAKLKVYEAAWLYDQGRDCGVAAATAKYAAAHAALKAADAAIQTLGGAGYISESGVERHWRNLRLNRIAPVTDEMTLGYIAQHDLGMPRSY